MIEINLIAQKKPFKVPVVLGVDFSAVNIKMLLIAIIISVVPDTFLKEHFDTQKKAINDKIAKLEKELKDIEKKLKEKRHVKKILEAFNKQVKKLQNRAKIVEKIVKQRSNPNKVLERLARSTPEDVWYTKLTIDNNNRITVEGQSYSYKSIGNFIITANESPFFGRTLSLKDSQTKKVKLDGREKRVETFKLEGQIKTYDPWN